jgi:hypothetical protein
MLPVGVAWRRGTAAVVGTEEDGGALPIDGEGIAVLRTSRWRPEGRVQSDRPCPVDSLRTEQPSSGESGRPRGSIPVPGVPTSRRITG